MADPPTSTGLSKNESTSIASAPLNPQDRLADLKAQALLQYSIKNYTAASDLYAQASELQAEINGDMSPENAEVLYLYGKSLYQVGVSKSDVLGGNVADEANGGGSTKLKAEKKSSSSTALENGEERVAEEVVAEVVEQKDGTVKPIPEPTVENKPYFQFTGDENFDDSDEEDDEEGAGEGAAPGELGEGEQEEDDLAAAWTVLDMARLLYSRQLDSHIKTAESKDNEKTPDDTDSQRRHLQERLADTHDLLAEISLEGEKFPAAVIDFKAALTIKKELHPLSSNLIAEAHYKLSLALEFASTTTSAPEGEDSTETPETQVDAAGRAEAASEMECAIKSCEATIILLSSQPESKPLNSTKEREKISAEIEDLKDMVADMKQRVSSPSPPPPPPPYHPSLSPAIN
jgi:HAT1-interacting factor 1